MKIAVASGKGGTGKTFVSTNLFYSLIENGVQATLTDCDAEEPNAFLFFPEEKQKETSVTQKVPVINPDKCTFCGKCDEYCNYNAIFYISELKIIKVLDDLCHGCGACTFACRKGAITEKDSLLGVVSDYQIGTNGKLVEARMETGIYSPVSVIKAAIKQVKNERIAIFDAPPGTSCPFIQTADRADYIILVTEPTPFGLSDLQQTVETLKTMNKEYGIVINRAGTGNRDIYEYIEKEDIELLLEIPFERTIAEHYSKGEIFAQHNVSFREKMLEMYHKIEKQYGNSDNQR